MKINRKIIINKLNKINSINSEIMLFEIIDKKLILRASNEYTKIQCFISETKEANKKYVISSKILLNILSKLKTDEVELEFVDDQVILHSEKTTLNLNVLNQQSFGYFDLKVNTGSKQINLTIKDFFNINQYVVPYCAESVALNSHLTNTNCVNISTNNKNELFAYGTDYKRIVSYKLLDKVETKMNLILYAKCFSWIIKVFNTIDSNIKVYQNQSTITIADKEDLLEVNLMQLAYPNVGTVIDDVKKNIVKVKVNDLLEALDRGLVITNTDTTLVVCDFNGNDLLLSFKNSEKGYISEIIKVENIKGEMSSFCINIHYLMTALKNVDSETVYFSMEDSLSALYLYSKDGANLLQVILPTKNIYN